MFDEEAYLAQRAADWRRLDELTRSASVSLKRLSGADVIEFTRLYRQASGDLAYLMSHSSNQDVVTYLNTLVTNAYGTLYRHRGKPLGQVIQTGLILAAETFRNRFKAFALSAGVFFFAAFYTFAFMSAVPDTREVFIGADEQLFDMWKKGEFEARTHEENQGMAMFYASHNPSVAIREIGLAAGTAGIGSTWLMWMTGKQIGALSFEMNSVGKLGFLLTSLFPHGVSEIGGFLIVSGAGYVIAGAVLFPGRKRRADALREAGKDGLVLFCCGVTMIFFAAPVEGFFSFNPGVPQALKAAVGLVALIGYSVFFLFFGREQAEGSLGS